MKKILVLFILIGINMNVDAQELKSISLSKYNLKRGSSLMETFQNRRSDREYSSKDLSLQDISDLLWAACGINRSDNRRTAPTARNCQEIDVYLINKDGAYLYVPTEDLLKPVYKGDLRTAVASGQDFAALAPISLVIVGDISKLGGDRDRSLRIAYCDAGIVSQNINMFCAGNNMGTVTRATMNEKALKEALKLNDSQYLILNNPVGYKK
jgi:SagB-type dehydrogenase family enzyme